jgi:hypothetical protein
VTSTNLQPHLTMSTPRWSVPSATTEGTTYEITVNEHGERVCSCEASQYPKTRGRCWHLKAVAAGLAGKPRVRVSQRPATAPLPSFTRARTSEAGRELALSLAV